MAEGRSVPSLADFSEYPHHFSAAGRVVLVAMSYFGQLL